MLRCGEIRREFAAAAGNTATDVPVKEDRQ
jgi:hypothetical protein